MLKTHCVTNLRASTQRCACCVLELLRSQDVTRCHKMSQGNQFQQQFEVDFCILAGCDYLPTISKVQMLQNACDVIQNQARVRWIMMDSLNFTLKFHHWILGLTDRWLAMTCDDFHFLRKTCHHLMQRPAAWLWKRPKLGPSDWEVMTGQKDDYYLPPFSLKASVGGDSWLLWWPWHGNLKWILYLF